MNFRGVITEMLLNWGGLNLLVVFHGWSLIIRFLCVLDVRMKRFLKWEIDEVYCDEFLKDKNVRILCMDESANMFSFSCEQNTR